MRNFNTNQAPEELFNEGLRLLKRADSSPNDAMYDDAYYEIEAAKCIEQAAKLGYAPAMRAIYLYDNVYPWFDCGLREETILWLERYLIAEGLTLNDVMNNDHDLFIMIKTEDLDKLKDI